MKVLIKTVSFLLLFLACRSTDEKNAPAENDVDAARNFIRATLDGQYDKARSLMVNDSTNTQWLDAFERSYNEKMSPETKFEYKNASINIREVKAINDSVTEIRYSNSYFPKDTNLLRVVRINDKWLVDLKSYFDDK